MEFSKIKSLFGSVSIYLLSNLLNASLPFLLLPFLTKSMDASSYGIFVMFQLGCVFVSSFCGLNSHASVARKFVDFKRINLAIYIANTILILAVSSLLVYISMYYFDSFVEKITFIPIEWHIFIVINSVAQFIIQLLLSIWQMQGSSIKYGTFQISQTLLNFGFTIYLVVFLEMSWQGAIIGQVSSFVIASLVSLYVLIGNGMIVIRFRLKYFKDAIKFGIPLIPHTVGATLISMTDRFMIANYIGINDMAIYNIGFQFAMIIALLQNSFNLAWVPWVFNSLKSNNKAYNLNIVKITYLYSFVMLMFVVILSLISPYVISYFIGDQFEGASKFIFWIGLGYAFNGMYKMVSVYIFYHEKTHLLAYITFMTAILNLFLVYFGIGIGGAIGASIATCFAFFISFLFTWLLTTRFQQMPWNMRV